MAYNPNKPANDGYLAEFPPEMREQLRAIINDQIVDALKLKGLSPGNLSGNIPVSNGTLCVNLNADKLDGNDAAAFATANHVHGAATTSTNGFMSNTDKAKLDGIEASADVNQVAFSNVKVGTTTIQADSVTDTLELVAGANIALTPDATNDRVTVAVTGTVANAAACTGNAATATTASACSGNAATATKLQTARAINGVSFDGSANITVTAAANGGTSAACTGNAATATKLQTARTIALTGDVTGSGTFDGSQNISIATLTSGLIYNPNCILPGSDGAFGGKISMGSGLQAKVAPFEALIGRKYHSITAEIALTLAARKASLIYGQKASSGTVPTIGKVDAVYPEPDNNTVAQWRFNATGTLANYAVGKSSIAVANNLTPSGTLTRVDGWCDYGMQTDGSTGYYTSANNTGFPSGNAEKQLEIMVTVNRFGGAQTICCYGTGSGYTFGIVIDTDKQIRFDANGVSWATGYFTEIGNTYLICLCYTADGYIKGYINGNVVYVEKRNWIVTNAIMYVGRRYDAYYSAVMLHFVELRNKCRTPAQIGTIANKLCLPCRYTGYASTYPANDSATGSHIYKFDEVSGTVVTDENGSLNGTATGTTIVDSDTGLGKARGFNGSGDKVSLPTIAISSSFTVITVAKVLVLPGICGIFANNGNAAGTGIEFGTGWPGVNENRLCFWSNSGSNLCVSNSKIPIGKTVFLAGVVSNGLVTFYVDSPTPDNTTVFGLSNYTAGAVAYIGSRGDGAGDWFNGVVDYLAIIPRALSQAEIAQYYNALMITADKGIIDDVLPADSISLGFARTNSAQVTEIDDMSYKYGRREGITGGNRRVFLGWKYFSGATTLKWDNHYETRRVRNYFYWSPDAVGSNQIPCTWTYDNYGIREMGYTNTKIGVITGSAGVVTLNDVWQTSGYIGCYSEVIE